MGGRGAGSGSSGGGKSLQVKSVVVQSGNTVDLSAFPLIYGKTDTTLSKAARSAVESFEGSNLKKKTEYGLIVDADGNQIYTAHGGKGSVSMPSFFYQKDAVMTHNHPRGKGEEGTLGGTFSGSDMKVFAKTPIATMRASAAEGTYCITKGQRFDSKAFDTFTQEIDSRRTRIFNKKVKQLNNDYYAKKITYAQYSEKVDHEFNHMLVGMHNDYLAGQKQYGYTYTLERRSS